jgi:hypothetical protein
MPEKPSDLVRGTLDMLILKTLALEPTLQSPMDSGRAVAAHYVSGADPPRTRLVDDKAGYGNLGESLVAWIHSHE